MLSSTSLPPAVDLALVRSAARLLADAGYLDDADKLLAGDPDLLDQIQDTDFLDWLAIGAPGGGASSEIVTLTSACD